MESRKNGASQRSAPCGSLFSGSSARSSPIAAILADDATREPPTERWRSAGGAAWPDTTFTRMQDATREDYQVIGRHSLEYFVGPSRPRAAPPRAARLRHRRLRGDAAHAQPPDGHARGARRPRRRVRRLCVAARHRRHARQREPRRPRRDDPRSRSSARRTAGSSSTTACSRATTSSTTSASTATRAIAYRGHPLFGACVAFCGKYDQNSFDPKYDTLPLEHFEPMVRKVFAAPRQSLYYSQTGRMGT